MKLSTVIHLWNIVIPAIILVVLFNFVAEIYPGKPEYQEYSHVTLYLDRNFDDTEIDTIISAALEWSELTGNRIEYDIIQMPVRNPNLKDVVFFVKRSPDDPSVFIRDLFDGNQTLGLFEPGYVNTISLVSDRLNEENYRKVVLHELGHSLGIGHLEKMEDMDTLMFPYTSMKMPDNTVVNTGSEHITRKDLEKFCELRNCDVDHLKD